MHYLFQAEATKAKMLAKKPHYLFTDMILFHCSGVASSALVGTLINAAPRFAYHHFNYGMKIRKLSKLKMFRLKEASQEKTSIDQCQTPGVFLVYHLIFLFIKSKCD